jgi:hypothetical protein
MKINIEEDIIVIQSDSNKNREKHYNILLQIGEKEPFNLYIS